jgi:S-disulfanyl-L-cysteine oxidoreductase SoxD
MSLRGKVFQFGLLLLIGSGLAGCDGKQQDYPQRDVPAGLIDDASAVENGRQLFMQKCVSCHGKLEEGRSPRAWSFEPPAPDFTETDYRQVDPAYLFWRIEVGKSIEPYRSQGSVMPGWREYLSDRQIWQLVAYLMKRAA